MDNESEECPSQVENENISVNVSSGNVVFSTSKLSTGCISHHASHVALFYSVVESPQFCAFSTPALRSKKRHFLHSGEYSGVYFYSR